MFLKLILRRLYNGVCLEYSLKEILKLIFFIRFYSLAQCSGVKCDDRFIKVQTR